MIDAFLIVLLFYKFKAKDIEIIVHIAQIFNLSLNMESTK
jgi:hypothetical protein